MLANHVMTKQVVTVEADASVYDAAEILLSSRISAAPVIDADGKMIGIVSESDLMHRPEIATVPAKSWLNRLLADDTTLAADFVRSHSHRVADVMTKTVVTAEEHSPLKDIAELIRCHHVKRIPIVRDGRVVGIVSRANLLQGLVVRAPASAGGSASDEEVRAAVTAELAKQGWSTPWLINVIAQNGAVHLWGIVGDSTTRMACQVAAEGVAGVKRVTNHIALVPPEVHIGT